MSRLLEQALAAVDQLSAERQDQIAQLLIDEINASAEWDRRFASTQGDLEQLANEALERDRAGQSIGRSV
jgi:hypothetical protein